LSNPSTSDAAQPQIVCRLAAPSEWQRATAMILGSAGRVGSPSQVVEFLAYAAQRHINVAETWVAEIDGRITWAALPVLSPGRTALLFTSAELAEPDEAAGQLIQHLCHYLAQRQVHLAQVLIDPTRSAARQFFADHGFREMAELVYLQGSAPRSAPPATLPPMVRWETYHAATHGLFARGTLATYQGSLDCPALTGLRDIEDVILGHKATGEFDPQLWRALCQEDQPLGILLLSRIPAADALELVYLGLASPARGRGLGDVLMQEAMHLVVAQGRRRLTLAVDAINVPALKLYYRFGLQRLTSKAALIRDLRRN